MVLQEDLIRKLVAEAVGTFILVLAGTGTAMLGGNYALAFGFALIGIVYALGHVSGAHVNPAVTLGLAVVGRFPPVQVPYYIGAQVGGALLASLFLRLIHGNLNNLGANSVSINYSALDGFLMEIVLTALFVFVIVAVATDKRVPPAAVGLAIGGTLLVIQIVGGPISGGSVNPARSLAPALVSWSSFADLWIYLTAPFIGAAIGAVAYEFVRGLEGWAEDRPGPEQAPPPSGSRSRQRQSQQRRPQPAVDSGTRSPQQRRPAPAQRGQQYDPDLPQATGYEDQPLPPQRPAQRQPQQRQPRFEPETMPHEQEEPRQRQPQHDPEAMPYEQEEPRQRPPQRRRPPQQ